MTTLHCDQLNCIFINLLYDAVTVLMAITYVLIYVVSYSIRTYKLLQPSTCIFYIISASIFIKMYYIHMHWCG